MKTETIKYFGKFKYCFFTRNGGVSKKTLAH